MKRLAWHRFVVLALAFVIPLSQYLSIRVLLVGAVLTLVLGRREMGARFFRNSWDLLIYFSVLIAGLLYSDNLEAGVSVLETNLGLIVIPIIFSRQQELDDRYTKQIFYAFVGGLTIACLICLVNATVQFGKTGNVDSYFYYGLTDVIKFQPTYFAYYLIFAITFGMYLLYYQTSDEHLILKHIVILFLFAVLMLTGGETAFISMLLIFSFFILKFLTEEKSKVKLLAIGFIVFMLLEMFLIALLTKTSTAQPLSDAWDRLVIWESAMKAIPNPFLGVGTGDYKVVLNQYYLGHGLEKFANESYNSHNQVIQVLFTNGVLGVLALVLIVARPLYNSFKNDNMPAILCLFPFLLYGVTEVFLGRYQGIVFFVFMHQFFMVQLEAKKYSLLVKPS